MVASIRSYRDPTIHKIEDDLVVVEIVQFPSEVIGHLGLGFGRPFAATFVKLLNQPLGFACFPLKTRDPELKRGFL